MTPAQAKTKNENLRWHQGSRPSAATRGHVTRMVGFWFSAQQIRALQRPLDFQGRRTARDAMLAELVDRGIVQITQPEVHAAGGRSASGIDAVDTNGILRVKQTARLLHIVQERDE